MSDPEAPHAEALAAEPAADAAPTAHKPKGSFKKMMAAKMKYVSAYSSIQTMLLYILAIIAVNSRAPCAGKVYADAGQREDPLMAGQDTTLEEVWDPLAATGGVAITLMILLLFPMMGLLIYKYRKLEITIKVPTIIYVMSKDFGRIFGRSGLAASYRSEVEITKKFLTEQRTYFDEKERRAIAKVNLKLESAISDPAKRAEFKKGLEAAEKKDKALDLAYLADLEKDRLASIKKSNANHKYYLEELKMGDIRAEVQKLFSSGKYEKKKKMGKGDAATEEPVNDPKGNPIVVEFNDIRHERFGFPTHDQFDDELFGSDLAIITGAWEKLVRAKERECMKGAPDEKFPWHHTICIYHGPWLTHIYMLIKGFIIEFGGKKFNWMRQDWKLKQFWKIIQTISKMMQFVGLFMLLGLEWENMGWETDADSETRTDYPKADGTFGAFKDGVQTEKIDPDCTENCEWLGCRVRPMVDLNYDSNADGDYLDKGEQGVMIGTGIGLNKQIIEVMILDLIILGGLLYWIFNKAIETKNIVARVQHTVWFDLQMVMKGYAMVPPVCDVQGHWKRKLKKQKFEHDAYTLVWNHLKRKTVVRVNQISAGEDGKIAVEAGYAEGFKYSFIGANGKLFEDEETCKNDADRIKWCEEIREKAKKYLEENATDWFGNKKKKKKEGDSADSSADTTTADTSAPAEEEKKEEEEGDKEKPKNPIALFIEKNMDSFKLAGMLGAKAKFETEKKVKGERKKKREEIASEKSPEGGGDDGEKEYDSKDTHPAKQEWKRYPILQKLLEKKDPEEADDEPPKQVGQSYISYDLEFMYEYRIWFLNTRPERATHRTATGQLGYGSLVPEGAKPLYPKEGMFSRLPEKTYNVVTGKWTDNFEANENLTWVHGRGYTQKEEDAFQERVKTYLEIKTKGDVRFKHVKGWKKCDIDDPHRPSFFAISMPGLVKPVTAKFYLYFMCTFGLFFWSPIRSAQVYFAYIDKNYGVDKFMKYNLTWYFIFGFIWMMLAAISLKLGSFGIGVGDISFDSLDLSSIARIDKIFTTGFAMGAAPNMNFAVSAQLFNSVIQGISTLLDMLASIGDAAIVPDGALDAVSDAAAKAADAAAKAAEAAAQQAQAAAEAAAASAQAAAEGALASAESGALNAMAQAASLAAAAGNAQQAASAMLDFQAPPVDGDKPEGAPEDWSEKMGQIYEKISEMAVMELPNLQEAMNAMDKLIAADTIYRAKYKETKEALTQEDGTLKTWPDGQVSASTRMYFVGILYAAEALFSEEIPEFKISGTKIEEVLANVVEKGIFDAIKAEAAEASGYNDLKDAVGEVVGDATSPKELFEAKMEELEAAARAKLNEMKDEITNAINDKKEEVIGQMKNMVKDEATKWVEENIMPKVEETIEGVVDELELGSTNWLPMEKITNFAKERIMGLFSSLIDLLINGKFNSKALIADAIANPLAGMSPKEMLTAGFEASKECGAFDEMHEAIEEVKEAVEEVKAEIKEAVEEVKETVKEAVNEATEGTGLGSAEEIADQAKEELEELKAPEGKKGFFHIDTFIERADSLAPEVYKKEKKKAKILLLQSFLIGVTLNFLCQIGTHPGFPFGKYVPANYA